MIGTNFTYAAPESLTEALDLIERQGHQLFTADQAMVSGLKKGMTAVDTLVSLRKVPGLATIETGNDELRLGASVTYSALLKNPALDRYPALAQALATISDPHLLHHSTVGGAFYHGGYVHAPVLAALLALDATAVVLMRDQETRLPVSYFSQDGHRVLVPAGGLLTGIVIPARPLEHSAYLSIDQLSGRQANRGIAISLSRSGQSIDQIRLVLAGFTEQPVSLERVEQTLSGQSLTPDSIRLAVEQLSQEHLPIQASGLSVGYQQYLAGVVLKRALTAQTERAIS
ncbi:FAD binding domain-containing protein [Spirosoma koreense]